MFRTLRAKLIVSYIGIAVLCLTLALGVLLLLARDFTQEAGLRSLDQKKSLAAPYIQTLIALEVQESRRPNRGDLPRPVLTRVRGSIQDAGLRVLLVDPDTITIREDTSLRFNAVGTRMQFDDSIANFDERLTAGGVVARGQLPGGDGRTYHYFAQRPMIMPGDVGGLLPSFAALIASDDEATGSEGTGSGSSGGGSAADTPQQQRVLSPYIVVVAQHQPQFAELFEQWAGYLLPALLVALAVSLFAAYFLGRSVARPVSSLALATQAMARGDYKQRVPVEGDDEFAQLSRGFNEMAEEVDRAHRMQRDFLANVSHELKTPLTSIQGFSQALLDGTVKNQTDYRQSAIIINKEAQRMNRLVTEILGLARMQNGSVVLDMRPLELAPILSELVLSMQPQAAQAGVNLAARYEQQGDIVMADADRLKQVLANLVENAVKYTPVGGTVTVALSREGTKALVQVRDTGRGIPPDDLSRVTERFYQVDKARTAGGENRSLGLGLAIAREIVSAHHGELRVESNEGMGTTVSVLLPARPATPVGSTSSRGKQAHVTATHPTPRPGDDTRST